MHFLRHLTAEVSGDAFKAGYTPRNQAKQLTHLGGKKQRRTRPQPLSPSAILKFMLKIPHKPQLKSRTINKLRAEAFLTGLVESFSDFLLPSD